MRVFIEKQRYSQSKIMILLTLSITIAIGIVIKEYMADGSTMDTVEFILILSLLLIFTLPVFLFQLITRIDELGIHYRFYPIHMSTKTILWSEIKTMYVRSYNAITEYGGWGLRAGWGKKNGKAINITGSIGIQLELTNGKKILIGTQKESEVKRVLALYESKILTYENH